MRAELCWSHCSSGKRGVVSFWPALANQVVTSLCSFSFGTRLFLARVVVIFSGSRIFSLNTLRYFSAAVVISYFSSSPSHDFIFVFNFNSKFILKGGNQRSSKIDDETRRLDYFGLILVRMREIKAFQSALPHSDTSN